MVATVRGTFTSEHDRANIIDSPLGLFIDDTSLQSEVRLLQQNREFQHNQLVSMNLLQNISEEFYIRNKTSEENGLLSQKFRQYLESNIDWRVEYIAHFYVSNFICLKFFLLI